MTGSVVLPRDDEANWLSLRNEPSVHLLVADQLNTHDVLLADQVVFTTAALNEFLGVPAEFAASADADSDDADSDDADSADADSNEEG